MRLAEEQFASGWFEVLLARAPKTKIDHLSVPAGFGALIIDTYECDDETQAYERLREFAQQRPLILLGSDAALFRRIQNSIAEFPQAKVIERAPEPPGPWLKPGPPTRSYKSSSIRKVWREIQRLLDERKIATDINAATFTSEVKANTISIEPHASLAEGMPVLIKNTYFPNWQRKDGAAVYPVTPFFMLTFVREPTQLVFARRAFDWAGLVISASTLLLLSAFMAWYYSERLTRLVRKRPVSPPVGDISPAMGSGSSRRDQPRMHADQRRSETRSDPRGSASIRG